MCKPMHLSTPRAMLCRKPAISSSRVPREGKHRPCFVVMTPRKMTLPHSTRHGRTRQSLPRAPAPHVEC